MLRVTLRNGHSQNSFLNCPFPHPCLFPPALLLPPIPLFQAAPPAPGTDGPSLAGKLLAISQAQTWVPSFTKMEKQTPRLQPGPASTHCSLLMAAPRYPARVPFRQMPSVVQARTPRIGFNSSLSFSAQMHSLFWYNDSGISLFSSFTLVCHHPQTYRLLAPSTGSPELWSHFHSSAEHLAVSLSPTTL